MLAPDCPGCQATRSNIPVAGSTHEESGISGGYLPHFQPSQPDRQEPPKKTGRPAAGFFKRKSGQRAPLTRERRSVSLARVSQAGGLRITLVLVATLAGGSCSSSGYNAYQMAGAGQVDKSAPIQSSRSIIVAAPPAIVWRLLTDMTRWPLWQPAITDVQMNGPARAGSHFTWNNGDTRIGSQVALVQAPEHLAWTGRASGLTAIHIWTLVPLRGGETLVRTEESMAGFPSSLFYSSSELGEANAEWLKRLKTAAEHH